MLRVKNNLKEGRRKLGIRTGEWAGGNGCVAELVRKWMKWDGEGVEEKERKWVYRDV